MPSVRTIVFFSFLVFASESRADITEADLVQSTDAGVGPPLSEITSENITHINSDKLNGHLVLDTLETASGGFEKTTKENLITDNAEVDGDSVSQDADDTESAWNDNRGVYEDIPIVTSKLLGSEEISKILADDASSSVSQPVTVNEEYSNGNQEMNLQQQISEDPSTGKKEQDIFSGQVNENDTNLFEISDTEDNNLFGNVTIRSNRNNTIQNALTVIENILSNNPTEEPPEDIQDLFKSNLTADSYSYNMVKNILKGIEKIFSNISTEESSNTEQLFTVDPAVVNVFDTDVTTSSYDYNTVQNALTNIVNNLPKNSAEVISNTVHDQDNNLLGNVTIRSNRNNTEELFTEEPAEDIQDLLKPDLTTDSYSYNTVKNVLKGIENILSNNSTEESSNTEQYFTVDPAVVNLFDTDVATSSNDYDTVQSTLTEVISNTELGQDNVKVKNIVVLPTPASNDRFEDVSIDGPKINDFTTKVENNNNESIYTNALNIRNGDGNIVTTSTTILEKDGSFENDENETFIETKDRNTEALLTTQDAREEDDDEDQEEDHKEAAAESFQKSVPERISFEANKNIIPDGSIPQEPDITGSVTKLDTTNFIKEAESTTIPSELLKEEQTSIGHNEQNESNSDMLDTKRDGSDITTSITILDEDVSFKNDETEESIQSTDQITEVNLTIQYSAELTTEENPQSATEEKTEYYSPQASYSFVKNSNTDKTPSNVVEPSTVPSIAIPKEDEDSSDFPEVEVSSINILKVDVDASTSEISDDKVTATKDVILKKEGDKDVDDDEENEKSKEESTSGTMPESIIVPTTVTVVDESFPQQSTVIEEKEGLTQRTAKKVDDSTVVTEEEDHNSVTNIMKVDPTDHTHHNVLVESTTKHSIASGENENVDHDKESTSGNIIFLTAVNEVDDFFTEQSMVIEENEGLTQRTAKKIDDSTAVTEEEDYNSLKNVVKVNSTDRTHHNTLVESTTKHSIASGENEYVDHDEESTSGNIILPTAVPEVDEFFTQQSTTIEEKQNLTQVKSTIQQLATEEDHNYVTNIETVDLTEANKAIKFTTETMQLPAVVELTTKQSTASGEDEYSLKKTLHAEERTTELDTSSSEFPKVEISSTANLKMDVDVNIVNSYEMEATEGTKFVLTQDISEATTQELVTLEQEEQERGGEEDYIQETTSEKRTPMENITVNSSTVTASIEENESPVSSTQVNSNFVVTTEVDEYLSQQSLIEVENPTASIQGEYSSSETLEIDFAGATENIKPTTQDTISDEHSSELTVADTESTTNRSIASEQNEAYFVETLSENENTKVDVTESTTKQDAELTSLEEKDSFSAAEVKEFSIISEEGTASKVDFVTVTESITERLNLENEETSTQTILEKNKLPSIVENALVLESPTTSTEIITVRQSTELVDNHDDSNDKYDEDGDDNDVDFNESSDDQNSVTDNSKTELDGSTTESITLENLNIDIIPSITTEANVDKQYSANKIVIDSEENSTPKLAIVANNIQIDKIATVEQTASTIETETFSSVTEALSPEISIDDSDEINLITTEEATTAAIAGSRLTTIRNADTDIVSKAIEDYKNYTTESPGHTEENVAIAIDITTQATEIDRTITDPGDFVWNMSTETVESTTKEKIGFHENTSEESDITEEISTEHSLVVELTTTELPTYNKNINKLEENNVGVNEKNIKNNNSNKTMVVDQDFNISSNVTTPATKVVMTSHGDQNTSEENESGIHNYLFNKHDTAIPQGDDDDESYQYVDSTENHESSAELEYFEETATTVVYTEHNTNIDDDYKPYIKTKVFGNPANFSIKIEVEDKYFYVPSKAYIKENKDSLTLNISWKISDTFQNDSVCFTFLDITRFYVIKGVQLILFQDNEMRVWERSVIVAPENGTLIETGYIIEFEGGVRIYISNLDFLKTPYDRKDEPNDIESMSTEIKKGQTNVAIVAGCVIAAIFVCGILYVIIMKSRKKRTLKVGDMAKHDIPA